MFRLTSWMCVVFFSPACFAAIGTVSVQTTPAQAVLSFTVSDPAQCLVQVYSDPARTQLVDDTNSTLFSGSQRCNRPGSAISGANVNFVAGLRAAQKAGDGIMHSRALAAVTTYYYTITDVLAFQTAQGSFATRDPAIGNMYPEQPPFDTNAWDNRAFPQFNWTLGQRNQTLVDPTSGLLVKRMTFAGDAYLKSQNSTDGVGAPFATAITGNATCSNAANLNSSGASYANCTGAATLFLPLPAFQMIGSGVFDNWFPSYNVDDLLLYAYGSADATAIGAANGSDRVSVCLAQGVNLPCLSQQFTVALLSSATATGTVKVPGSTAAPVFANWGYTPLHGDVVPTPGTVSVSGTTVSLTNPGQAATYANAFDVDWPPGSHIYIQGSSAWGCVNNYCTIQSIQSAVQLTTVESCNSACPASANYEGRAFGFLVTRQGTSGSINVSFGFEADMSSSWSVLEDGVSQRCNQNPVTVSNDAAGNPYSGYTLQGYICTFQHYPGAAYWLLISKDQFGGPLGETRPLGPTGLPYTTAWNSNGASFPNGAAIAFAGWHPTDGAKFVAAASYNNGTTSLLVSAQYDPTKPGCSPPYMTWAGAQQYVGAYSFAAESCFTYTNLTNPSANPPMDLTSQIVRAYALYNPSVNLAGFIAGEVVASGGYARTCLNATGGGDRKFVVCGTFDTTSGTLVQIFDSFSKAPGRWGYVHGPVHALGQYHALTSDPPYPGSASAANVLYGPFEMAVTAVNRAGYGQTPNWTAAGGTPGSSIAANEGYACPTGLPAALVAQGASGNYCIQVQVSSEPCSHTPGSAAIYPGGKTEAQQFPCTSTDGSVVTNAAWSKLQNLAVGDWMRENETYNDYGERFIVVQKNVISAAEIQLWLIRGSGIWPNNAQPPYYTLVATHPDGFSLAMTGSWSFSASNWMMDATDPTATWLPDNPAWVLTHGASTVGSSPDRKTALGSDLQNQSFYAGFYDQPVTQQIMQALPDLTTNFPLWAGSSSAYNGVIQTYMDADQVAAPAWDRRWMVNYRHLNPSAGNGPEYRSSPGGTDTLTPVAGTNHVYLITDPYSGGPADPKNLPFITFAGRFLLKDISGRGTTQNTITDATNFSVCYALNAGECRTGSSAGAHYVSVPYAAGENQCLTNQYEEVAPCFFNSAPAAGKIQQMDISGLLDKNGARQRMLPPVFTGIGGQYQFSEPKMSPDGAWMLLPCWWLNGVRSEICGEYLPPLPAADSVVRTSYEPYDVNVSGISGDQVRLCWGYAENGPVDGSPNSLYPTTRQERGCSIGAVSTAPPVNSASFLRSDTTTQGNWQSVYGSDGYNVIANAVQYPGYVNVTIGAGTQHVWSPQTTDIRALQEVGVAGRIAACIYNSVSLSVDFNFTDTAQHQVAVYFLDWDPLGRIQTVQMLNGATGAVLDSRVLSNYQNGIYLVWNLSGHVTLNLINQGPHDSVFSGIFFGNGAFGSAPMVSGPFGWASEAAQYAQCGNGCLVRMNLIPDRVAYYVIERNRGGTLSTSPVMVVTPH